MQTLAEKSTDGIDETFSTAGGPGARPEQSMIAFAPAQKSRAWNAARRFRWRLAIAAGCAIAVLLLFGIFHSAPLPKQAPVPAPASSFSSLAAKSTMPLPQAIQSTRLETDARSVGLTSAGAAKLSDALVAPSGSTGSFSPMIARTVSLTIQVIDVGAGRAALDAILARCRGYAAELNINTPENAARSFTASLRIPAPVLDDALIELRKLGRVQNETQAGEEVTQQHTDLVARLKNARETEQRLQAILQQRTGKVEEVLEVEEQISSTRGEIERMEAEQKALEHRVDFATVQLQLAEEFKAQLNAPSASAGTRMRNAIVNGLGNAGDSILGILLFLEEYGPALLVWFGVLGTPAWLVWRRYRRAESRA